MEELGCDEIVLETEITNQPALRLGKQRNQFRFHFINENRKYYDYSST